MSTSKHAGYRHSVPLALWVLAVGLFASACATTPSSIRPATVEPFLGQWSGNWSSHLGKGSGEVSPLLVEPFLTTAVSFRAEVTNDNYPGLARGFSSGVANFANGELILDRGYLRMRFTLHGTGDDLRVQYSIHGSGGAVADSGAWVLKRIPRK